MRKSQYNFLISNLDDVGTPPLTSLDVVVEIFPKRLVRHKKKSRRKCKITQWQCSYRNPYIKMCKFNILNWNHGPTKLIFTTMSCRVVCIQNKTNTPTLWTKSTEISTGQPFWPLVFRSAVFLWARTGPVPVPKAVAFQRPPYFRGSGPLGPPDCRGPTTFYVRLCFADNNKKYA